MSRGMPSEKALGAALAIARARGRVITIRTWEGCDCDFLIDTPHGLSAVCVRRSRRIRSSIAEIAGQHRETLNAIRSAGHCSGVACEFWLWSPYGTMRFFLVEGFSLIELTPLGIPLVPPVTGKFAAVPGADKRFTVKRPAGETCSPENRSGPADPQRSPGPGDSPPAKPEIREPAPVRYLRRRNAEILRMKAEDSGQREDPGPAVPPAGGGGPPPA